MRDTDELARQHFVDEGVFLLKAELAAKRFTQQTDGMWKLSAIHQSDLQDFARQFSKAVQIAKEYHEGASEL